MARPFRHDTPDRLQIHEGGGCLAWFGAPFFAAGVFMALTVAGAVPVSNAGDMPRWGWSVLAVMALGFAGVGGTMLFGRAWTTLDITRRLVIKQWGPLLPLHERTYPLAGYSAVTLGLVRGDSDSADSFPVGLKARTGASLLLCSLTTYADARECAIAVARHLHVEIEDSTSDHHVRVTPADAGRPLRDRATRRPGEHAANRPADARSRVTREPDGVRVEIPAARVHPVAALAGMIPLAVPVFVVPSLIDFFRRTHTPGAVGWAIIAFITVFFGVLPAMGVFNGLRRSRRGATIVVVSPRGIELQERGAWRTRTTASIDASDILDVDYSTRESAIASARLAAEQQARGSAGSMASPVGPRTERLLSWLSRFATSRGLIVKTRTDVTSFGDGLADEEIVYLHAVIRGALLQPPHDRSHKL